MTPLPPDRLLAVLVFLAIGLAACGSPDSSRDDSGPLSGWPEYGGDKGGMRYVLANQVTSENVDELEIAWVHHNGDSSDGSDGSARTSFNVTPILVDDTLVFCTPMNRVVAIDAETGADRWAYDPVQQHTRLPDLNTRVCRGVAYWEEQGARARARPCGRLRGDGRQFVVVAAGGHAWSDAGDALVAFALPD